MGVRIVTIGAAVQDVFLAGEVLTPKREDDGSLVAEFALGSKLDLEKITFSTGGGATNAAVTFSRLGMDVEFMGQIAHDPAGAAVIAELSHEGVNTARVVYSKEHGTGYSTLLLAPSGERTILTYRGASTHYNPSLFNLDDIKADWIYVSTLAGNFELLEKILSAAKEHSIKVAFNPGKKELAETERLKALLPSLSVLSANKDEAALLFGEGSIEELAQAGAKVSNYCVVTDGPKGEAASDGQKVCSGGMYEDVPVIDRTGAGDAFTSGFVAMLALEHSLEEALLYASANSTSVVGQIGAKAGILRSGAQLHSMSIQSREISEAN